jgi:NAD+ diphosphatase
VYLVHPKGVVARRDGAKVRLPTEEEVAALGLVMEMAEDAPGGRAVAFPSNREVPEGMVLLGLREAFGALGQDGFMAAGVATQLVEWRTTHRFCGRCATPTERSAPERSVKCPACGLVAFPRIAPAVIVLVRRGEEALLARGARFPLPFYSTLAGFVEVGETLEDTVAREIREEVGVEVQNPRYFGSQPWPFPHSLMVGFTADWASGDIHCDPAEIVDAAWFQRDALPQIPPPLSIARRLIDAWLQEKR